MNAPKRIYVEFRGSFVDIAHDHERHRDDVPYVRADVVDDLLVALTALVGEYCDYTRINKLGDPETQHNIKLARAAIAKAEGRT